MAKLKSNYWQNFGFLFLLCIISLFSFSLHRVTSAFTTDLSLHCRTPILGVIEGGLGQRTVYVVALAEGSVMASVLCFQRFTPGSASSHTHLLGDAAELDDTGIGGGGGGGGAAARDDPPSGVELPEGSEPLLLPAARSRFFFNIASSNSIILSSSASVRPDMAQGSTRKEWQTQSCVPKRSELVDHQTKENIEQIGVTLHEFSLTKSKVYILISH